MGYEVKVDKETCIGCGSCEAVCPKTFKIFEGKAIVNKTPVSSLTCEEEARDVCPVSAITIIKK